jgi:hypothetical protein
MKATFLKVVPEAMPSTGFQIFMRFKKIQRNFNFFFGNKSEYRGGKNLRGFLYKRFDSR